MSRSNPNENMSNPAQMWIEYHGGGDKAKTFSFYDKEAINEDGSKGKNISLGSKIAFMFLDQTYTVTGWNEPSVSGVYANEIKDIKNGIFSVKSFKGQDECIGKWADIKNDVKAMGGKFTSNIYVAYKKKDGSLVIAVIQLKGISFSKWNDFKKSVGNKGIEEGAVKVVNHLDGKKGSVVYVTPVFELIKEVTPESNDAAIELDKELQEYLTAKISVPVVATPAAAPVAAQPLSVAHSEAVANGEAPEPMEPQYFEEDDEDSLPF